MKTAGPDRKLRLLAGEAIPISSMARDGPNVLHESSHGIYITDCEGPITRNDNAFELSTHFIPEGDRLFAVLSRYDDVLAYTYRRKGYRVGNTLKMIVPFLKAYGATNQEVITFCRENMVLVPKADSFLRWVNCMVPTFLISTSYEPYVNALCDLIGFPKVQAFCTQLDLDKYELSGAEIDFTKRKVTEILQFPILPEAGRECSKEASHTVESLDQIFEELSRRDSGMIMGEVKPVGGEEKTKKVLSIISELKCGFAELIYVGDSITDVDAFKLVKESGGLTVSFNGNRYAVENAEIAIVSRTADALRTIVSGFLEGRREGISRLVREWDNAEYPKAFLVTPQNSDMVSKESSKARRNLRGEKIGSLG